MLNCDKSLYRIKRLQIVCSEFAFDESESIYEDLHGWETDGKANNDTKKRKKEIKKKQIPKAPTFVQ